MRRAYSVPRALMQHPVEAHAKSVSQELSVQLVRICAQFVLRGHIRKMLRPSAFPVQQGAVQARTHQAAKNVVMVRTVVKVNLIAYSVRMVALLLKTALHASPEYSEHRQASKKEAGVGVQNKPYH